MNKDTSHEVTELSSKGVTIIDSEKGINDITPERLKELQNSPEVLAMDALYERLENGTATEDERIDHEIRIEMMNRMPLDKMTSYHW